MSIITSSRLLTSHDGAIGPDTFACSGTGTDALGSYGAWVELIASTAEETTIAGVSMVHDATANHNYTLQYGIGAAASEVAIGEQRVFMPTSGNHFVHLHLLEVPIGPIAAGTRIAMRVRDNTSVSSGDIEVALQYFENFDSTHQSLALQTYAPIDERGESVTPNAVAFDPSSWVEWIPSLAADGVLLGVSIQTMSSGTSADTLIIEIGTGAAASEVVVTTIRTTVSSGSAGGGSNIDLPAPFPIAAGTRVAFRLRKTGTVTAAARVALRYIGEIDLTEIEPLQLVTQQALLAWYDDVDATPPDVDACTGGGTVPTGTNPSAGEDLSTATAPIPWVAITIGATVYRYASGTVPHSPPRYGRVASFGSIKRELSEPDSGPRAATMNISLVDTDGVLRALANAGTLKHALIEAYVSDLPTIVAEGAGARQFRGRVSEWSAEPDRMFAIVAEDELTARLTSVDAADLALGQTLFDDIADTNPEELAFGKPAPEVYGNVSDEDEDEPAGVWQLAYVSSITFPLAEDLGNNHVFPISLGAVGQVQSVFGASPFEDPPVTRVKLPASAYGDWLWVVTMSGWFQSDQFYVDGSAGHRWALVVLEDGHPTAELARSGRIPLTVNVCGYETIGDSTGATINSIPRGFLHWINARLLQDGSVGDTDWPTTIFALGDHSLIETTSFEAVHEYLDDLGYILGGVLGWDYQFESWRDRWAAWLRHMGYDAATGYNKHGQIILTKLDRTSEHSSAPAFTRNEILEGGCRTRNRDDAVENVIRYVSQQNYRTKLQGLNPAEGERGLRDPYDGPWLYLPEAVEASGSISDLGGNPRGRRQSAIQEYGLTRDVATADALAQERLDWLRPANGRAEIAFDLSLRDGAGLELGDVITLDHPDLVWTGSKRCQVRGLEYNLDSHVITVTVWYVDDLLP